MNVVLAESLFDDEREGWEDAPEAQAVIVRLPARLTPDQAFQADMARAVFDDVHPQWKDWAAGEESKKRHPAAAAV